jgi:hypothetical protein
MAAFRNFANAPKILDIIHPPCNKLKQRNIIAKIVQFVGSETNFQKKSPLLGFESQTFRPIAQPVEVQIRKLFLVYYALCCSLCLSPGNNKRGIFLNTNC